MVSSVFTSCGLLDVDDDYFTNITQLYGTEWTISNEQATMGLKFYKDGQVMCFLENQYGIQTVNGVYNYIVSSKMITFDGIVWYDSTTHKPALTFQGAHIIDRKTMKVTIVNKQGEVEYDNFYRQ